LVLGEWFNADPEAIIAQALQTGGGPNVSDAYTFNGLPGPLYNCSAKGIYQVLINTCFRNKNIWTSKNNYYVNKNFKINIKIIILRDLIFGRSKGKLL
jgi:hypothetical protein